MSCGREKTPRSHPISRTRGNGNELQNEKFHLSTRKLGWFYFLGVWGFSFFGVFFKIFSIFFSVVFLLLLFFFAFGGFFLVVFGVF